MSGLAFRLERDMFAPLMALSPRALEVPVGAGLAILRQPTLGGVVPDLLLGISGNPQPLRLPNRWLCGVVEGFVAHELLISGPQTFEALQARLGLVRISLGRAVNRLQRVGLIRVDEDGVIRHSDPMTQASEIEIVAIEAKLHRWRKALAQAAFYRRFADRSYVAIDATRTQVNERLLSEFSAAGVGLLLCDEFEVVCVLPAPRVTIHSPYRARAALRLHAAPMYECMGHGPLFKAPHASATLQSLSAKPVDVTNRYDC